MLPDAFRASIRRDYLDALFQGNRSRCREMMVQWHQSGLAAREVLSNLVWPTMCKIRELYCDNELSLLELNMATRLNRAITDRLGAMLPIASANGRRVIVLCGNAEPEELGGQICADLFESEGYGVSFLGGSLPDDEILEFVGKIRPNVLVLFATLPSQLPAARKLIDYLHQVNSCPSLQILCCGGVYQRAEGLAAEIGADLYAPDAEAAIGVVAEGGKHRASVEQQTVGRTRRLKQAAQRRALMAAKSAMRHLRKEAA
jgi:methanogenic corrinoid protein MtbC1